MFFFCNKAAGFVLILLGFLLCSAVGAMAGEQHWEYWNTESFDIKTAKNTSVKLEKAFRFHEGKLYYTHSDLLLSKKTSDSFKISAGYRHVDYFSDNRWKVEARPYGGGEFSWKMGRLEASNRHLMECRMKEAQPTLWRYRTRIKVEYPLQGKLNITPYVSDEMFIELNGQDRRELKRNRLYLGVEAPLGKNARADLFYMAQTQEDDMDEGEIWRRYNVMGLQFKFSF